jgi:hypothetical protein
VSVVLVGVIVAGVALFSRRRTPEAEMDETPPDGDAASS